MSDTPDTPGPEETRTGEHRMLPVGTVLAGRYELVELVGVGGMGLVYRAEDRRLDLEVALKVLTPERAGNREALERFERELVLARQVSHPNVVRIHDIGQDGDLHFLTMDYVSGRSLSSVLQEEGALPVDRAVAIAADLAEGLAAAHDKGVVHRDLKPANVLLDEDGRARITDFGVARSLATPGPTRPGHVLGTPYYLSPEQALGEPVDGRSDLYALGLLLYEMLSGRLPFSSESFEESVAQRVSGRPRPLSEIKDDVPEWLQQVIRTCLARKPEDRYPDADSLLSDLRTARASRRQRRGGRLALLGAGATLLIAVLFALWWYWPSLLREDAGRQASQGETVDVRQARTVAVLPFADETGDPSLRWVQTGLAEMVAVALAEVPALQVVDSMRVFRTVDDLGLDASRLESNEVGQLATLLDADRLVTGRVRSTGDGLLLEVRLVSAREQGDPRRFTTSAAGTGGLLEAMERLGADLRNALAAGKTASAEPSLSENPKAMAAYGTGVERLTRGDSLGAVEALEQAIEADPRFAAAWVRLSEAYDNSGYGDKALEAARRAVAVLDQSEGRIALEARARGAAMSGDIERALELRRELVGAFPNDIEARVALGELQGDTGRLEDARQTLESVVARDPNHPRAWYLLGKFAILGGESRVAIDDYLVRALVIQNRLDNQQGKADVLNAMGIAYAQLGELAQAQENYEQAAAIREQIGDRRGVAATLSNLAKIQVLRGDYDGARARLQKALEIQGEIGDRAGVAYLHNEFGVLEEEQGNYSEALRHYRDALRVRQDLGNERALAESYNNVGYIYYLLGEYDNAAVYAQQALERYSKAQNQEGVMLARQTLGLLESARGNWETALSAALKALEISRTLELPGASAVSLGIIGRVNGAQGRFQAALDSYREALKLVSELGNSRGMTEFALARAGLLLELNALDAAAKALEEASGHLAQGGNREQRAGLTRLRGRLALQGGDTAEARSMLQEALEQADESGSITSQMRAKLALARSRLADGDPEAAAGLAEEVAGQAGGIGHAVLALEALELKGLALAQWDANAEAAAALNEALGLARQHAPYAGTWRLHLLLARLEQEDGETGESHLEQAAGELSRVLSNVPEPMKEAFTALPEVAALHERIQVTSR